MPQQDGTFSKDGDGAGEAVTYQTAEEYIKGLNEDSEWILYDKKTNTAKIKSIKAFVIHCKNASKAVGAFDDLNRNQAENILFGNDANDALHFDETLTSLLQKNEKNYAKFSDWDSSLLQEYANDLEEKDSLGKSSKLRQNMYNPMYYLLDYYEGYDTSNVAPYWRINTGINQGDTANTVEINLALALEQCRDVKQVDFSMVWGMAHTLAERTGDSTSNFISWVQECCESL